MEGLEERSEREVKEFLAGCVPAESVSLVGALGKRVSPPMPQAFLLVRAPKWNHDGIPRNASACESGWAIIKDDEDLFGVLVFQWPNGQERKLSFNLRESPGNFPEMLVQFAKQFAEGSTVVEFGITADKGVDFGATFIEIDLADDDAFAMLVYMRSRLREGLPL